MIMALFVSARAPEGPYLNTLSDHDAVTRVPAWLAAIALFMVEVAPEVDGPSE
jgi:hypothetical protein